MNRTLIFAFALGAAALAGVLLFPKGDLDIAVDEVEVRAAAQALGAHLDDSAVCAAPEVELPKLLVEQTVSIDTHRFGNLGPRARGARDPRQDPGPG